jgi:hypothetical protein
VVFGLSSPSDESDGATAWPATPAQFETLS